jgi:hypothetical protein
MKITKKQLRNIIRESIEEILAHDTVTSAYNKMKRYGSHNRAINFAKNYAEILNREYPIKNNTGVEARFLTDSNELNLKDDTNNYFLYNVKDDDWYVAKEGKMVPVEREPNAFPKFNNRQTVNNLCKFMKQLKPDTGLANKQYYIL